MPEINTPAKSILSKIGGFASKAAPYVGFFGSAFSQMIANKKRAEEAEKAYKREQASIREMNQYNSPSMQMLRLRAAGINPMSIASQGNFSPGLQSQSAQGYPAQVDSAMPAFNLGINSMLDAQRVQNDTERTQAEVMTQSAYAFYLGQKGGLTELEKEQYLTTIGLQQDEMRYHIRQTIENINNLKKDGDIKDVQSQLQRLQIKLTDEQVKKVEADTGLSYAQIYAILEKVPHEIGNIDADTVYKYFLSRPQLIAKTAAEIELLSWSKTGTQVSTINAWKSGRYIPAQNITGMVFGGINAACNLANTINGIVHPGVGAASAMKFPRYNMSPGYEPVGVNPYE